MTRLTLDLLRKRCEHQAGSPLHTLAEAPLSRAGLEDFAASLAAHCRRVRQVHLQGNVVGRLEREALGKLKDLHYLNLAMNNLAAVRGLARCECLARLDLSANFIRPARLRRSVGALARPPALIALWLVGNPCGRVWKCKEHTCTETPTIYTAAFGPWCPASSTDATAAAACRAYVIARLPRLLTLDGLPVQASERAAAAGRMGGLEAALQAIEAAEGLPVGPTSPPPLSTSSGVDAAEMAAMEAEVDAMLAAAAEDAGKEEEGAFPADDLPRPWTRAARLAEQRAQEARAAAKEASAACSQADTDASLSGWPRPGRHTDFPPLRDEAEEDGGGGSGIRQANEGAWHYSLTPSDGGSGGDGSGSASTITLELGLGKGVPAGDVRVDVTPRAVRVLVANRTVAGGHGGFSTSAQPASLLLQLALPARVCPPASTATRSRASGALVVTMPMVEAGAELDLACVRERRKVEKKIEERQAAPGAVAAAVVVVAGGDDDDDAPPLPG